MKYLAEYQYVISMNINDIPVQFYRRYSCHLYTAFLSDFQVNWNDEGFATFHEVCWHTLIKRLSKDKASGITKAEGDMIKEALKTAEIHDSYEKLKKEAEHVAHLIKNSEYCIAFTGIYILYALLHPSFYGSFNHHLHSSLHKCNCIIIFFSNFDIIF